MRTIATLNLPCSMSGIWRVAPAAAPAAVHPVPPPLAEAGDALVPPPVPHAATTIAPAAVSAASFDHRLLVIASAPPSRSAEPGPSPRPARRYPTPLTHPYPIVR